MGRRRELMGEVKGKGLERGECGKQARVDRVHGKGCSSATAGTLSRKENVGAVLDSSRSQTRATIIYCSCNSKFYFKVCWHRDTSFGLCDFLPRSRVDKELADIWWKGSPSHPKVLLSLTLLAQCLLGSLFREPPVGLILNLASLHPKVCLWFIHLFIG